MFKKVRFYLPFCGSRWKNLSCLILYRSISTESRTYSIAFCMPNSLSTTCESTLASTVKVSLSVFLICSGKINTHGGTENKRHKSLIVSSLRLDTAPDSYFWMSDLLTCNLIANSSWVRLNFFLKNFITSPVYILARLTFFKII